MKKNKPIMRITLSQEYFNALFTMFDFYKASENHHGVTYQSKYSQTLENKIKRYGYFVKTEDGDGYQIHFFENEMVQFMNIFVNYICNGNEHDFFTVHKNYKEITLKKLRAVLHGDTAE